MSRVSSAFRSFFSILFSGELPEDIAREFGYARAARPGAKAAAAPAAAKPEAAKAVAGPAEGAVELLAALQAGSRLLDFLMEDIGAYADDQVGAAVRDVHAGARQALERAVKMVPVIDGVEGAFTKLEGVAKNSYKLLGNVPAEGKVTGGTLRHRGWRVESVKLAGVKPGERLVAQAEIEVE